MKKLFLAGIASAMAIIPAAQAAPTAAADMSIGNSAQFKRGEDRRGDRGRSEDARGQRAHAGQGERGWRGAHSPQAEPRSERRAERRDGWSQQQQDRSRFEGRAERRDEAHRRGRDDSWNRNGDANGQWNGRSDDNRNDSRWQGRRDDSHRSDNRRWRDNSHDDRRDRWDRDWRNDNRYNWRGHRERYRSYYRPGRYYAPYRNDHYRRFSIGIYLGSPFYANRYWIADPWQYRLPPAHGPYRWVRYYDDVLLIDIRSGHVVDVIHDFFW